MELKYVIWYWFVMDTFDKDSIWSRNLILCSYKEKVWENFNLQVFLTQHLHYTPYKSSLREVW